MYDVKKSEHESKGCDPRENKFTTEGGDPIRLSCTCGYRAEAESPVEAYRMRIAHMFPLGFPRRMS